MKFLLSFLFCFSVYCLVDAQPTPIVSNIVNPSGLCKDADTLYFTSFTEGTINQKVITESTTSYITIADGFTDPFGLHKKDSLLFVGHRFGISQINLSNDQFEIIEILENVNISDIEIVDSYVYYSAWGIYDEIWRIDLFTGEKEVVSEGYKTPTGLVYWNNLLFVADNEGNKIYKIDLNSDDFETTIFYQMPSPNHLTVDGDTLYIGQFAQGTISKINLADENPLLELVIDHGSEVTGISAQGEKIYFSAYTDFTINKYCPEVISSIHQNQVVPFSLYPNPSTDMLKSNQFYRNSPYLIMDMQGKVMQKGLFQHKKVDIQTLPSNTYIIYLQKEQLYAKFVKI